MENNSYFEVEKEELDVWSQILISLHDANKTYELYKSTGIAVVCNDGFAHTTLIELKG